jgi:phosphatidylglycerol:prolipoprotein diacylglycerol transferase
MDSAMAGALGTIALVLVVIIGPSRMGAIFLSSMAGYIFGRQVLFPLREAPRRTAHGRVVMLVITAITFIAGVVTLALIR